jgi:lipid-A-disaccharide synthase-like uncharacterized protein
MSPLLIFSIGLLAQCFFASRILVQWFLSEKAKKVVSPSWYWILSILGSYLFFIYGWLRTDFAILLGQFISYFIYLWNLNQKGLWKKITISLKVLLLATPFLVTGLAFKNGANFIDSFLANKTIPVWLIVFGSAGQMLFTFRFVYQWLYSSKKGESLLPTGFWIISIAGSGLIMIYGIIRKDPVLIIGQLFGFFAYTRNIFLNKKNS